MRIGGPVEGYKNPEQWIELLKQNGYAAAYCPVSGDAADSEIVEYRRAADENGIVIAETGAWSNPLSPDPKIAEPAFELCVKQLRLADRIGANCCVNIAGGRCDRWDGFCAENYSKETFNLLVSTVKKIIDTAQPARSFYSLEMMQWMLPDSVDSYLELIGAIDRPQFAVHIDMVNIINQPRRYYSTGDLTDECFSKLGTRIKSCHVKDILLVGDSFLHFEEVPLGEGNMDLAALCKNAEALSPDLPLMLEHLPAEKYPAAQKHLRDVAKSCAVQVK